MAPADLALHMTDTLKCDRIAQKARAVYFFTPSTACLLPTAWLCPNPRHWRQSLHPSITVALEMRAPSFVIERREPKLTNWKSVNPFQSSQISPPHVTHSVGSVFGRCAYKANSVPHIDRARNWVAANDDFVDEPAQDTVFMLYNANNAQDIKYPKCRKYYILQNVQARS